MPNPRAILVVDLAFGDCGKGTIIEYLARTQNARAVVRFNGGPQAGHNVVTPDGRHHTFSQFASAAFVPGVKTILSRFMLIEPYAMLNEASHLAQLGVRNPMASLVIDRRCLVITPAQQAANRLREIARGKGAHGTCGMGIGETMQDAIDHPDLALNAGDLSHRDTVIRTLRTIQALKVEQLREAIRDFAVDAPARPTNPAQTATSVVGTSAQPAAIHGSQASARPADSTRAAQGYFAVQTLLDDSWIEVAADNYLQVARLATIADEPAIHAEMLAPETVVFEGAQGVLLDEYFGFHPHTTWSNTTFANADALLNEAGYAAPRTRLGVLRSYFTRHGPGPFVSENPSLKNQLPEPHNADTGWQGAFRVGLFDAVAARYAIKACGGLNSLAITHLDRLGHLPPQICTEYVEDGMTARTERSIDDPLVRQGERIIDINPHLPATLVCSARRTAALAACRPIPASIPVLSPAGFIDIVECELGAKVTIASSGPTADQKRMLASL
ncbi:MAG TPA: adenylosuccinate synthetase [Tepidisphaeraceae bacterium]|nr:adenylosuccinate synthetase [Tepidisphaeraceae bacterium]